MGREDSLTRPVVGLCFQWYRENKSLRHETNNLKRQSAILMQRVAETSADLDITALAGMADTVDKKELQDLQQQHEKEIDSLMEKIKGNVIVSSQ